MINAKTKLFGVIGDPVSHSLSPVLHNYFMERFGINGVYLAFHVKADFLKPCISGMQAMSMAGLNVTVPHKEHVALLADELSDEVAMLSAANTLVFSPEHITANITDPYGFIESLGDNKPIFDGATVVLFGAGGSAKSIAYVLGQLNVRKLYIINRSQERCQNLASLCRESFKIDQVECLAPSSDQVNDCLTDAKILINATTLGMHPNIDVGPLSDYSALRQQHFVYDLIYNPEKTLLLRNAEEKGARVQNGLDMLIYQGLQSLCIWTDEQFHLSHNDLQYLRKILTMELQK